MNVPADWWRSAVFYQIYPRSYKDSNGDGIGDLKGIAEKLDYVAALGVDAIWLSPFFASPMRDFGYDVSDYRAVDPMFGTLDDFDAMLGKAHRLGLKVIIDQVMSHSSIEHAWFQESRASRDNPKADWYVWADAKPDGSPPNNWQSVFGGPSWDYDVRRGQYYLHNFLPSQPDLNIWNPEVRAAILGEAEFWLRRGVDGFRLDAINFAMHDPLLRDNPVNPNPAPMGFNISFATPHTMQIHEFSKNRPETLGFLREIRALLDRYPGTMALGEVGEGGKLGDELSVLYTSGGDKLHTCYNFSLLGGSAPSAGHIRHVVEGLAAQGESWPSWAFSNHDVVRVASRWHPDKNGYHHDPRLSRMLLALLLSLRGTIFLYEGEELGLPEAPVPFESLQDPWGKYLWPLWQGRDGSRTPMPWTDAPGAGFTDGAPWLPIPGSHQDLCAARQETDPSSTLHFARAFLKWRKAQTALCAGAITFHETGDDTLLCFTREGAGQSLWCVFNLKDAPARLAAAKGVLPVAVPAVSQVPTLNGEDVELPPYGFFMGSVSA